MPDKKLSNLILAAILALISVAIYFNSLHGEFLIDDQAGILNNNRIHDLKSYLSNHIKFVPGALWELIYAFCWAVSGPDTFCYHFLIVLANAGCVVLIFLLCSGLFKDTALAFLAALIFSLHPIHTEAVCWISAGHYVVSSFFYILTLLFYARSNRSMLNFILALISFVLCVLIGNTASGLPAMLVIYELFFREKNGREKISRRFRLLALFLIILIGFVLMSTTFIGRNKFMHKIFYFRGPSYLIVVGKALVYYLKIIYLPLQRGLYHPFAYTSINTHKISPAFFLSLAVIITGIFSFFRCLKNHKPVSLGIAWFFINYLPFSNIIPVCNIVSERYVYLASFGLILILAYLFLLVWKMINRNNRYRRFLRIAAMLSLSLFLLSYAILTVKRNREYNDIITYWETNINNFPDGFMAYNNLAGTYYALGESEQALAYSWVTLMINKDQPHVWCNLGKVYREQGNLKMSIYCYKEALKIDKSFSPAIKALKELEDYNNGA